MKFTDAIETYIRDMRLSGRINSLATERTYRSTLEKHAEDIDNRDPKLVGREDVKATLARWPVPNTQRVRRATLVSFYRWAVEEGIRPNNPAEQTRRPKKQATSVYRLTLAEVRAMFDACNTVLESRAIRLGICGGLRNQELRGLQGRHFRRAGFIWVSADIGKGHRERWIPVLPDLADTWLDIHKNVADDEYVLPAQRWRNPGRNTERKELTKRPMSPQGLYYLVGRVGERAGIHAGVHPHLLRHANGDHIAKHAGLLIAQAMLGHKDVSTTRETYVGAVSLDALAEAIQGLSFGTGLPTPSETPAEPSKAPTGIEPVNSASRSVIRDFGERLTELRVAFANA